MLLAATFHDVMDSTSVSQSSAVSRHTPSDRTPGLFTDVTLATREIAFQRWLLARHIKSAARWGKLAQQAPAIDDLRSLCIKRVPEVVLRYFLSGSGEEISLNRNRKAFTDVELNPTSGVKFESVNMSTTVLGRRISMPIITAPVGSQRSLWPEGEAVAAQAAGGAGLIYCLSTLTGTRMERVKEAASGPCWFQLYLVGGREVAERGIKRARKAGYDALILTIDTAVAGNRLGDRRNRSSQLIREIVRSIKSNAWPQIKLFRGLYNERIRQAFSLDTWRHLSFLTSFLADGQLMDFPNIELEEGEPMPYAPIGEQLKQSAVTWADLEWIRNAWVDRPIIIKGVHNIEDARRAEKHGAAAIVVSNHGGRQEDGTPATLHMLQEIAPQLKQDGSKMEIYLDGGVRTGKDVVVARACGARAVLIGRALAFAIGAGGPVGAARCFDIFRQEIEDEIRLLGKGNGSIDDIDENILYKFKHRIT
jgi:L-lactate dehydrogenase (cytochrome)